VVTDSTRRLAARSTAGPHEITDNGRSRRAHRMSVDTQE
jgi:hypothetical protein